MFFAMKKSERIGTLYCKGRIFVVRFMKRHPMRMTDAEERRDWLANSNFYGNVES